jgi:hypothetical protein
MAEKLCELKGGPGGSLNNLTTEIVAAYQYNTSTTVTVNVGDILLFVGYVGTYVGTNWPIITGAQILNREPGVLGDKTGAVVMKATSTSVTVSLRNSTGWLYALIKLDD